MPIQNFTKLSWIAAFGLLLTSGTVQSQIYGWQTWGISLDFETTDQSMWGPGNALVGDYEKFIGIKWDESESAGEITNVTIIPGGCTWWGYCWGPTTVPVGAEVYAKTNGRIGLEIDAKWDTGSVNVSYPMLQHIRMPTYIDAKDTFTISTSYDTSFFSPEMKTNFPEMHLSVEAALEMFAAVGGEVCAGGCVSDEFELFNIDKSLPLVDITSAVSTTIDFPAGIGSIYAAFPDINTTSIQVGELLESHGSDNFLELDIDLDRLITNAFALPPLEGGFNKLGIDFAYNILDVEAGLDFGIQQDFWFEPIPMVSFDMGALGTKTVKLGDTFSDKMPDHNVPIQLEFWLDNLFHNKTSLLISPNMSVDALEVVLAGHEMGPLLKWDDSIDFTIPLFESTYRLGGFNRVSYPYTITMNVPEPSSWLLFVSGIVFLLRREKNNKVLA
ncbi:hypothetical protein DJ031_02185 [bacterium endosymbiont of Escarpia laminata]|nr:MAG: hypothetical protein DJ031_02185 [bacterium endosymbiont of Escarpia laminata]